MPIITDSSPPLVYQFHVLLLGVSPAIWRRILLAANSSLADLHFVLQITMGWRDSFLNRFILHGRHFSVAKPESPIATQYPEQLLLLDFHLHPKERFLYTYNFLDFWQLQIRLECLLPYEQTLNYPYCLAGARAGPPDFCGGPAHFMALRDQHSSAFIEQRAVEINSSYQAHELTAAKYRAELQSLDYWRHVERFDRSAINRQLQHYAAGTSVEAQALEDC